MSSERDILRRAAVQLVRTDLLLGGDTLALQRHGKVTLPKPKARPAQTPTAAPQVPGESAGAQPRRSQPAPRAEATPGRPQRQAPAPLKREPMPEMTPQQKAEALQRLEREHLAGCKACSLCQGRHNVVFGEGDPAARVVFIGEGPGEEEDLQGRPFVGRAGQLLNKMLDAMGLDRQRIYIANMVKCRPPANRAPTSDEVHACWGYLVDQLRIIRPEAIVTLGNAATQNLLQTREGITRIRGKWHKLPQLADDLGGIDVMPTFHPAYVLRYYTPRVRGMVWDDLQQVMERIGLKP